MVWVSHSLYSELGAGPILFGGGGLWQVRRVSLLGCSAAVCFKGSRWADIALLTAASVIARSFSVKVGNGGEAWKRSRLACDCAPAFRRVGEAPAPSKNLRSYLLPRQPSLPSSC